MLSASGKLAQFLISISSSKLEIHSAKSHNLKASLELSKIHAKCVDLQPEYSAANVV